MYSFAKPLFGYPFTIAISGGKQQVRRSFFTAVHTSEMVERLSSFCATRHRVLLRNTSSKSAPLALCSTVDSSTMGSKLSVSSLHLLLLLLVEVHSQTFPYVSFGLTGPALANHSYVDLSTVGSASDDSDSVVCYTDLTTCCSGGQGIHRGNWYFPNGTVLPFSGNGVPIYLGRAAQRVAIRHTSGATGPTGIYRCDIPTIAVHSDTDQSVGETVYVGLYPADGGKLKHRLAADINLPIVLV